MVKQDIRPLKNRLREQCKAARRKMTAQQKQDKDIRLFRRLISLERYRRAKMVITFVSTPIEVDTHNLILYALTEGKQVVVPRCVPGTRLMDFCLIRSFDDLEPGTFSVLEPKQSCEVLTRFDNSLCVVPGLAFDMHGFRLGYGKGYYDRFLNAYHGYTVGICYNSCLYPSLPHGRFDCAVDLLVTESFCKRIQ